MQLTFWGTRGSIAKAGPSTLRYGGNTSCVEVRSDHGTLVVIDCGTGAHGLGQQLVAQANGAPVEGHLLISHTHWDHIQGLPFFAPLFGPDNKWHIYGPRGLGTSLTETLSGQMQYAYFPVTLEQLAAGVVYHDLVEGDFTIDDIHVSTHYLNHPALTLGYRLEVDGASIVYSSDHEPHHRALAGGGDIATSRNDRVHAEFFANADLLVHDAQYLAEEYPTKVGWGHSTVEYVVDAAHHAGVRNLALYHHDPTRDDAAVDALVAHAEAHAAQTGYSGHIFAAAEGMTVVVDPAPGSQPRRSTHVATRQPALAELRRAVVITAHSTDIAATLTEAAQAEGFAVFAVTDHNEALELVRAEDAALILVEDIPGSDEPLELAERVRALDPDGLQVAVLGITTTADRLHDVHDTAMTDWLLWPSSVVYLRTKLRACVLRRACRWQNAPLPPDEESRLEALRALDILDTVAEERFDKFTKAASETFDVPIALVSIVDENRQWFKSHHGLDATETHRDMAFCAHAILDDDVLQVADALGDPRFADNPLVNGDPRVRFYAGVPLKLTNGARVGTMCVVDYRPRTLDDAQLAELRRLGDLVSEELERGSPRA